MSLRARLALSYAGFLVVAGLVLVAVLLLVLRFVPEGDLYLYDSSAFVPDRSDLLDVAVPYSGAALLALAVIGTAGGWLLAGRVLRPVHRIGVAVRAAASGSLAHRVRLPGPDDELRRLAADVDDMLDRLERAFEDQRRFTADASHELRTPQAVVRTMLEVARADPDGRDVDLLLARLQEVNERSIATLEALLQLARAERGGVTLRPCDLAEVVHDVIAQCAEQHGGGGGRVRLEASVDDVEVAGDPVLLGQLVRNLLDNARVHNLPAGGAAWVRLRQAADGRAVLEVASTGEELEPEVVGTLTQPFVRAQGRTRRAAGPPGSGLGLAVVAAVARVHRAELAVHPRAGGGLAVTVTFPAGCQPAAPRDALDAG